jgi:hypothetical protein
MGAQFIKLSYVFIPLAALQVIRAAVLNENVSQK